METGTQRGLAKGILQISWKIPGSGPSTVSVLCNFVATPAMPPPCQAPGEGEEGAWKDVKGEL